MKAIIFYTILFLNFSPAHAGEVVSMTEKSIVVEMSNILVSVGECVLLDDKNFLSSSHFYTADFAITRKVKNKVWLKDAEGHVIPSTATVVEQKITQNFNASQDFFEGDCVSKNTCNFNDSNGVLSTCEGYRKMYLNQLPKK